MGRGCRTDAFLECLSSLEHANSSRPKRIDERHESTLEWLWDEPAFEGWRTGDSSALLCLVGKPASGKSVLTQFAKGKLRDAEKETVASFFFHADGPQELRTSTAMLRGLLYDMLSRNRSFFPHFQRRFRELKERGKERSVTWQDDDLIAVFEGLLRHPFPEKIYALVDGLDESENPSLCAEVLAKLLARVPQGGRLCIKLLVATQPGDEAERALAVRGGIVSHRIVLQEWNADDIRAYSRSFLNAIEGNATDMAEYGRPRDETAIRKQKREWVESMLDIIVERSENIFLWAKLVTTELVRNFQEASPADVEMFLGELNSDIQILYERLYDRLKKRASRTDDNSHMRQAERLFQIVVEAKRPLMLDEFCDAYILPKITHLHKDPRSVNMYKFRPQDMAKVIANNTANFLEVDEETRTGT